MEISVVVTGAGGFIGHHMVKYLVAKGYGVRGVDIKPSEYEPSSAHQFELLDLRRFDHCLIATRGANQIYHFAADMGGIGYITANHADITRNNTMIDLNMLEAAHINGVNRFLFASSACIYPQHLQRAADVKPLKEENAWPADPEEGYGLEKLYTEKLCEYYLRDYGLDTRVVRFHNVYGPLGTYDGGKEKAPAAICRKIALLEEEGEIEIWGDGEQTRSFMYIDDCIVGIDRIMHLEYHQPLNLGTEEIVTINSLVDIVVGISGKRITKRYEISKPQGVRGRNSDNTKLRQVLSWEPNTPLSKGLLPTYRWIEAQVLQRSDIKKSFGPPQHKVPSGIRNDA